MTLDDKKIRTSDAVIVYRELGASNSNRLLAWNFMKTRYLFSIFLWVDKASITFFFLQVE